MRQFAMLLSGVLVLSGCGTQGNDPTTCATGWTAAGAQCVSDIRQSTGYDTTGRSAPDLIRFECPGKLFPDWTISLARSIDSTEVVDGRSTSTPGLTPRAADTIPTANTPLPEALFFVQQAVKESKAVMGREDPTKRWTAKSTDSGFAGTQFRRHAMGREYRLIEYAVARSAEGPAAKIQVRVWRATVSPLTPAPMTDEERRTHCA